VVHGRETFGRASGKVGRPCHNYFGDLATTELRDHATTKQGDHSTTKQGDHAITDRLFYVFLYREIVFIISVPGGGAPLTLG
jgi:hypothetical protein